MAVDFAVEHQDFEGLNESPSKKEGKFQPLRTEIPRRQEEASMKAPPRRKGNLDFLSGRCFSIDASMKAPPRRKGNSAPSTTSRPANPRLNESPSKKEGKLGSHNS